MLVDYLGIGNHCNILAECFSLTIPTCYEYEEIREEFGFNGGGTDNENPEARYRMSKMGKLEIQIRRFDFHQLPYLVIPDEITIPADGSPTLIPIRSYKMVYKGLSGNNRTGLTLS